MIQGYPNLCKHLDWLSELSLSLSEFSELKLTIHTSSLYVSIAVQMLGQAVKEAAHPHHITADIGQGVQTGVAQ